jgi:hypothetical protein
MLLFWLIRGLSRNLYTTDALSDYTVIFLQYLTNIEYVTSSFIYYVKIHTYNPQITFESGGKAERITLDNVLYVVGNSDNPL